MKIEKLMKTLWYADPLTKLAYFFVAGQRSGAEDASALPLATVATLTLLGTVSAVQGGLLGWFLFRNPKLRSVLARVLKERAGEAGSGLFSAWVVALGLGETASLFGLVLSVQSGELTHLAILTLCTTAAWAFSYPRLDLVTEAKEES